MPIIKVVAEIADHLRSGGQMELETSAPVLYLVRGR